MAQIHIVQHVDFEGAGHIETWATEHKMNLSYSLLYLNHSLPKTDDFDVLIIMGGPMGIYDDEQYCWLTGEKEFIKNAIAANKKVLGICLGAQLVAHCLGAKVKRNSQKEIGWFPVWSVAPNPLFHIINPNEPFMTFHWHGDTFDIPNECTHLFQSEACKNQGFIYNDKVIGLQFHAELTPHNMDDLIANGADELIDGGKYIQPQALLTGGIKTYQNQNKTLLYNLLNRLIGAS
jgi:GMP synthase-like glutamine amidotransferase